MQNRQQKHLKSGLFLFLIILGIIGMISSTTAAEHDLDPDEESGLGKIIEDANDGDTINLGEGTYDKNVTSIHINKDITIIGKGADKTFIDAKKLGRIFNISSTGTLTLINLTLINGKADNGGSIYNEGTLTIKNSKLNNNGATENGGAIYNNNGIVKIISSDFNDNSATKRGGGIWNNGSLTVDDSSFKNNQVTTIKGATKNDYGGGAIFSQDTLKVDNSIFHNNSAASNNKEPGGDGGAGGAILILDNIEDVTITKSIFTENSARHGGAVMFYDSQARNQGIKIIDNCTFNDNTALYAAITIYSKVIISNSKFDNNIATGTGSENRTSGPGAINVLYENLGANATIINCTFTNNKAINEEFGSEAGAIGIYNDAIAHIENCYFENNTATNGGAIYSNGKEVTIKNSTFINNEAKVYGGAIFNKGNLTVTGNIMNGNIALNGNMIYNNGSIGVLNLTYLNNTTDGDNDGDIELIATLTDDMGNAISGGNISFYVNEVYVGSSSSEEGIAKIIYRLENNKTFRVSGDYDGHDSTNINIDIVEFLSNTENQNNNTNNNNTNENNNNADNKTKNIDINENNDKNTSASASMKNTGIPLHIFSILLASLGLVLFRRKK